MSEIIKPKIGEFYYHKRHQTDDIYNYAYQVVGLGFHTETEEIMVAYTPLYTHNNVVEQKLQFYLRPLSLWTTVAENGQPARFTLINDPEIIKLLNIRKEEMYPNERAV